MFTVFKKLVDSCFGLNGLDRLDGLDGRIPFKPVKISGGAVSTRYANGLLSSLVDAAGRQWNFTYAGGKVVRFTDPTGSTWCEENGRWHGFDAYGKVLSTPAPQGIVVDQNNLEVCIGSGEKKIYYIADGSTCTKFEEIRNGKTVQMAITEYSTIPSHTKIAVETNALGQSRLRFVEDANGRVYRFEYDGNRLVEYLDISPARVKKWQAVWEDGKIARWTQSGSTQTMSPHLESCDLTGNRFFTTNDGKTIVVKANGSAYAQTGDQSRNAVWQIF